MASAGGGNIKVVVRVRPFNSRGERKRFEKTMFITALLTHHRTRSEGKMYCSNERQSDYSDPSRDRRRESKE